MIGSNTTKARYQNNVCNNCWNEHNREYTRRWKSKLEEQFNSDNPGIRGKVFKSPKVSDAQRDRVLTKQIIEQRAEAEEIWRLKKPKNELWKLAYYIQGKTIDDHLVRRVVQGVMFGLKYGAKYYPQTNEEKYLDGRGGNRLATLLGKLREDPQFGFISIGTELIHENPDTGDFEFIICDLTTMNASDRKQIKPNETAEKWQQIRQKSEATHVDRTTKTIDNSMKSKPEREKLEGEGQDQQPGKSPYRNKNRKGDEEI